MGISEHLQMHKQQSTNKPEMAAPSSNNTSNSSNGSFYDSAKLQGENRGVKMLVCRSRAGDSQDCCINIYVSNNIQGVNNSILVGSKVKMGDPGVRLTFRDIQVGYKTFDKLRKRTRRSNHSPSLRDRSFSSLIVILLILFFLFWR